MIDLKLGRFTHADVGQMHLYLNYAKEYWVHDGENPPVGVILCAFCKPTGVRLRVRDSVHEFGKRCFFASGSQSPELRDLFA